MSELVDIVIKENFDVDSYENNFSYSSYDIVTELIANIKSISTQKEATKIVTNGNLGMIISHGDRIQKLYSDDRPYRFGFLSGTSVYVNPRTKWDDNKVFFYKEEKTEPIISDIDPYGEEDWGIEEESEKLVFELNIKDTKGRLL